MDGIDITRIHHSDVRRRCFVTIPQDPLVFPELSLRFNLDPSGLIPEYAIYEVLKKTRLKKHFFGSTYHESQRLVSDESVITESDRNLLDLPLTVLPPLSTGQLQLFSLARGILRAESLRRPEISGLYYDNNRGTKPIILLDEATSSLDPDTELAIQEIMHDEFTRNGHTVVVVAHRRSILSKGQGNGVDTLALIQNGRIKKVGSMKDMALMVTGSEVHGDNDV